MVQLAFYNGKENFFNKMTCWRTNGNHSHVEIIFADGFSFSSSQWDGGVRFKDILYTSTDKWDILDIPDMGVRKEKLMKEWCESQVGKKYDYRGILRFFVGVKEDNPDKWFCSEICCAALQRVRVLPSLLVPSQMSPEDLYIAVLSLN